MGHVGRDAAGETVEEFYIQIHRQQHKRIVGLA